MSGGALRPGGIAVGIFDTERRLRSATPDFAVLLGLPAPPPPGMTLRELMAALPRPCLDSLIADGAMPGDSEGNGLVLGCCDIGGRRLELAEQPLAGGGWVLAVTDITALNHTVEQLRLAREVAEAGARAKARFLSTMSHELRTPLNAVIGFAETLAFDAARPEAPPEAAEVEEYALHIRDAGRHLLGLIDDMLDLVRLDSGAYQIASDTLDAARLVQTALRAVAPAAQEAGLELRLREEVGPLRLSGDERRLRRLLGHLLDNAIKFSHRGGEIELSATRTETGGVAMAVQDQGRGMAADEIERALLPFHQLDTRLSRRIGGTGLGLYFCRAVAEAHGGRLHLASRPGIGTTATLVLPVSRLIEPPPSQQLAQAGNLPAIGASNERR